ncbi:MAG TPA: ribosome small subunit-dependent GTPase A, partial [Chloroflexi bacterium]|nr:ribosome small subunit-dependent GTPase A [Chloroflexota bacterium]
MAEREGIVVRRHGGHYYVDTGDAIVDCTIRGRVKRRRAESDLIAVGDRVRWTPIEGGRGIIERVLPRRTVLSRTPPPPRAPIEQVIVANPDQVLVVMAMASPPPNPFMLDRYLVACEAVALPALIVANKIDLADGAADDARELFALYEGLSYGVYYTSATTGQGVDALRDVLRGKLSVLTGPSGTGKSSLLNALWPDLELRTGEVSAYHDRGRHTTVVAQLLRPERDTYVADTPGLRQFRFWDIDPEQLEAFFPEFRPFLGECRFQPCTHTHEPDCAIRAAAERGAVPPLRYESYV